MCKSVNIICILVKNIILEVCIAPENKISMVIQILRLANTLRVSNNLKNQFFLNTKLDIFCDVKILSVTAKALFIVLIHQANILQIIMGDRFRNVVLHFYMYLPMLLLDFGFFD